MIIEYHPAIEGEIEEIRNFYEARSPGLGREFVEEFDQQIIAIAATPERWMIVSGDIRRCLMRRFPYVIYFRRVAEDRVRITVVKHERRHPEHGRSRK